MCIDLDKIKVFKLFLVEYELNFRIKWRPYFSMKELGYEIGLAEMMYIVIIIDLIWFDLIFHLTHNNEDSVSSKRLQVDGED